MNETCESRIPRDGMTCPAPAQWKVRAGTREADAQLACARHLSPVCRAMYEAEHPRRPVLTVTALPEAGAP